MNESFESGQQNSLSEEQAVTKLDSHEFGAKEAMDFMGRYADQCHAEAEKEAKASPKNIDASNSANIKAEIKIVSVYARSKKYRQEALDAFEEILVAALQSETTSDLARHIELEIRILNSTN